MRSLLRPKRAIVLRCRNCQFELSLKSKGPYTDNRCPCCETISLFVPDDIPATKLEQLYRFIDDDEKLELLDEEHDELMEKYDGFSCSCPCTACNNCPDGEDDERFQYRLSDETRERLT